MIVAFKDLFLQKFRDSFYQKEMDHLNKQQSHADWLQQRREKYTQQYLDSAAQRDKLAESREVSILKLKKDLFYQFFVFCLCKLK